MLGIEPGLEYAGVLLGYIPSKKYFVSFSMLFHRSNYDIYRKYIF
jgi:hypothetical protein